MSNIQHLVTSAEARHPNSDDELAAHLTGKGHPMPHPERYDHGYVKPASFVLDLNNVKAKTNQVDAVVIKHPGPITMREARTNWHAVGVGVVWFAFWGLVIYGGIQWAKP